MIPALKKQPGRDPYAWVKSDNWRDVLSDPDQLDPELAKHLAEEKAYYDSSRDLALEKCLFDELRGRMPDALEGVPLADGEWEYHWRYADNASHPKYLRRYQGGAWQCYFDAEAASQHHEFFDLGALEYAPCHSRFAMTLDTQGNERYRLSLRDDERELAVCPDDCQPQVIFSKDSQWLIYILLDSENRGREIRAWQPESGQIRTLYRESDTGYFLDLSETQDGQHGILACHQHQVTELYLIDLDQLSVGEPIIPRTWAWEADLNTHGENLILKSNHEREDFALYQRVPGGDWQRIWQPERGLLSDYLVLDQHLIVLDSIHAAPVLRWRAWDQAHWQVLDLPEPLSDLSMATLLTSNTTSIRLNWSSPRHPAEHWELDLESGSIEVLKRQEIPSGHNPDNYRCERVWIHSGDVKVPLTVLKPACDDIQGILLYGYGAYGLSLEPAFSSARLSLVSRGLWHVTAHVRGGMELGYHWYRDGRDEQKSHSFDDFEAALDWSRTQHSKVLIHGGSAGGMLVGALLNRRAADISGMLADVPFMDVLNTMLDADLPLTPPEWPEWGNPITDHEAYDRIQSYAPYENLAQAKYPPVLVTAGLTDPRVTYWEPIKYVAKLREHSPNPVYLRMETLGHGGASGRFGPLGEVAECYSWVLRTLGIPN